MTKIKISSTGEIFEEKNGANLLDALLKHKVFVESPCNKKGTCGKCKILIRNENFLISDLDKKFLNSAEISQGVRLTCDKVLDEDLEIDLIKKAVKGKILTSGYLPDFQIDKENTGYGIAIDIGTTTVAMDLVDLENGRILASESMINPQNIYGSDVLTRITYQVENGDIAIKELKDLIVASINEGINSFKVDKTKIKEILVAANTTMAHFLLGVDARSLGKFPYKPSFTDLKDILASDVGISAGKDTRLITLPNLSAFIGSDIVAGAYVAGLNKFQGNVLFIDIGTNGEIVLSKNGKLVSCSCAAGPALEGMNVSYGMRSEPGAIEDLKITKNEIHLKVIDDVEAFGLCGSGILATIRELIKHNMILKNGAIIKKDAISEDDYRQKYIGETNRKREIIISENPRIIMTQGDIRSVQLSKGAILSGFMTLLAVSDLEMKDLDKILVAGQFGAHLPNTSLVGTGILPETVFSKIEYLGNTSKSGAYIALLNKEIRNEMEKLAEKMDYIELAVYKDYEKLFRESLYYPVGLDIDNLTEEA